MHDIFERRSWSTAEALLYMCRGTDDLTKAFMGKPVIEVARNWLLDRQRVAPTNDDKALKRIRLLVDVAKRLIASDVAQLHLPPAVWVWFATRNAKRSMCGAFTSALSRWTLLHRAKGRLPVVQCRVNPATDWQPIDLLAQPPDVATGVEPSALLVRRFNKKFALAEWRLLLEPTAEIVQSREKSERRLSHTPNSSECQALVVKGLVEVARRTKKVIRHAMPEDGKKQFSAPSLSRHEVLSEVAKTSVGERVANYGLSTQLRAVSNLATCRRGRPAKPDPNAPADSA